MNLPSYAVLGQSDRFCGYWPWCLCMYCFKSCTLRWNTVRLISVTSVIVLKSSLISSFSDRGLTILAGDRIGDCYATTLDICNYVLDTRLELDTRFFLSLSSLEGDTLYIASCSR